ncbi:hypothetical protein [Hydrogenibacillus sp. N12]|uniref:hypothetical protein n=1 Tax=Hydrogenibacillus sp. N12 TaxID=2866627 RepID=UPI001C7CCC6E|nr:hypothetical protein [Hydrogenibacillus sp. N12]QZA32833.1 hypothetical protein K2M58_11375 [Hydrogenibacillus sp. N12]
MQRDGREDGCRRGRIPRLAASVVAIGVVVAAACGAKGAVTASSGAKGAVTASSGARGGAAAFGQAEANVQGEGAAGASAKIAVVDVGGLSFAALERLAADAAFRALIAEGDWALLTTRTPSSRSRVNVLRTIACGRRADVRLPAEAPCGAAGTRPFPALLQASGRTVAAVTVEAPSLGLEAEDAGRAVEAGLGLRPFRLQGGKSAEAVAAAVRDAAAGADWAWVAFDLAGGVEPDPRAASVLRAVVEALREEADVFLLAHPTPRESGRGIPLGLFERRRPAHGAPPEAGATSGRRPPSERGGSPKGRPIPVRDGALDVRAPAGTGGSPEGRTPSGTLLTAATTRWPGIVAAVDLVPTWAERLGLRSEPSEGAPVRLAEGAPIRPVDAADVPKAPDGAALPGAAGAARAIEVSLRHLAAVRQAVMPVYVNAAVGLTALAGALAVLRGRRANRHPARGAGLGRRFVALAAGVSLGVPLADAAFGPLLGLGRPPEGGPPPAVVGLLYGGVALALACLWLRLGFRRTLAGVAAAFLGLFALDQLGGYAQSRYSLFGYDPLLGARFYGLGNERMGLVVAGAAYLLARMRPALPVRAAVYAALLLFLGAPWAGANFGGSVAWLAALPVLFPESVRPAAPPRRLRQAVFVGAGAVLLGVAGLFAWHAVAETPSHLSRLAEAVAAEGVAPLQETIVRKGAMNVRLMRTSLWGRLFFVAFIVAAALVLFWARRAAGVEAAERRGAVSALWVSAVNAVVNDSGVVAAALGLLFAVYPIAGAAGEDPGPDEASPPAGAGLAPGRSP